MKLIQLLKEETVLCIAGILAAISCFFITPDIQYLEYIDFRTLSLLFCLMTVMAELQQTGVFRFIAEKLVARVKTERDLVLLLVLLCFFSSMLITNDVALITFVPFSLTISEMTKKKKIIIPLIVMETIAANLGSMFTPIGNPQNLYLFSQSGFSLLNFIKLLFPYTAISLGLLVAWIVIRGKGGKLQLETKSEPFVANKKIGLYLLLFLLCLLTVANVLDYKLLFVFVVLTVFSADKRVLKDVDYSLLLTFLAFFIFVGNLARIPLFRELLQGILQGRTVLCSVAASQIISNVPATLLLSGFTNDWEGLLIGTNLGGLGTLIASMASLISFKYVGQTERKSTYLLYFTLANLIFLVALLGLYFFIG